MTIEVGDIVKVRRAHRDGYTPVVGIVTHIDDMVCVKFPGWTEGHAGEREDDRTVNRFYFAAHELKVIGFTFTD